MFNRLDHLLALIDARLAALRASRSPDYAAHRADYERRAADYAAAIEVNGRALVPPKPIPTTEYVETLWRAVQAGAITWEDVRSLQAQHMPTCAEHNAPAVVRWEGKPICETCIKSRRRSIAATR